MKTSDLKQLFGCAVYTFRALARLYYPWLKPEVASRSLRRLLHGDPYIMESLVRSGYKNSQRKITPKQISIVIEHLGTPWEFAEYA